MEIVKLPLAALEPNAGQIEGLPVNPRQWTKSDIDTLARSLTETPELFEARPIIVVPHGKKYVILCGNLRYEGAKKNKSAEVPCVVMPASLPVSKLKEIVIKDNGSFGEWDFDALANEWDDLDLSEWGVDIPSDWGALKDLPTYPSSSAIPGAENLPPELAGVDINPADLPKIEGSDEVALERIIIVYPKDKEEALAQTLGLKAFDKVVYPIQDIPLFGPIAE